MPKQSPLTNLSLLVAKWTAKGGALGVWCQLLGLDFPSKTSRQLGLAEWLGDSQAHAAVGGAAIFGWVGLCVATFLMAAGCKRWDRTVEDSFRAPWDILTLAFDWAALLVLLPLVAWLGMGAGLSTVSLLLAFLSIVTFIGLSLSGPLEAMKNARVNNHPLLLVARGLTELIIGLVIFTAWLSLTMRLFHFDIISIVMWPLGIILFVISIGLMAGIADSGALETKTIGVFILPARGLFSLLRKVIIVTTQAVNPIVAAIIFCIGIFVAFSLIISMFNFIIKSAQPVNSIVAVAAPMIILIYMINVIANLFNHEDRVRLDGNLAKHRLDYEARIADLVTRFLGICLLLPLFALRCSVQKRPNFVAAPIQYQDMANNNSPVSLLSNSRNSAPVRVADPSNNTTDQGRHSGNITKRKLPIYVAYDFDDMAQKSITDKSTNATHNGNIQGVPSYVQGPPERGSAAFFNGRWRILVSGSGASDFSFTEDWTMGISIFPGSKAKWGNGLIQRASDNSGLCGYRGIIVLADNRKELISYDRTYNPNGSEGRYSISLMALIPDQWNRLLIVHRKAGKASVYINGIKIADNVALRIDEENRKKLSIGGNYLNLGCYSDDFASDIKIDDFAILARAISENIVREDSLQQPIGF